MNVAGNFDWGWAPLPPLNSGRSVFIPSPRRRYRRCMNGARAQRHVHRDYVYKDKHGLLRAREAKS